MAAALLAEEACLMPRRRLVPPQARETWRLGEGIIRRAEQAGDLPAGGAVAEREPAISGCVATCDGLSYGSTEAGNAELRLSQ